MEKLTAEKLGHFQDVLSHKISQKGNTDFKLLGEVQSCIRGQLFRDFFVDKFPDFSAALSTAKEDLPENSGQRVEYISNVVTCYAESDTGIKNLLLNVPAINWNTRVVFTGMKQYYSAVEEAAATKGGTMEKEICNCFHVKEHNLVKCDLPKGYHFSELTSNDAALVTDAWDHKSGSEETKVYIHWLIQTYPSVAVYDETQSLVAYMLQNHNGSMGFLRVHPDHRRKGIAQAVLTKLAEQVMAMNQPAYVFTDNLISAKLHVKCGFEKLGDVFWGSYTPGSCKDTSGVKCCV